jgi:(R)-2-hydroxyacyl-CoA dehydratese activating ATPase
MITAGCDVGSLTSKAVLIKDGRIIESAIIKSKPKPAASASEVMDRVLSQAGLVMGNIARFVGTGYGRDRIPFVNETATEIACHARGALWLVPSARTVIDIGGQDCKAIKLDAGGAMVKFTANDKCASGTGRFLEVMARVLGIKLSEIGELSSESKSPITIASACTVWAQADVIQYLNNKVPIADIAAGINNAMAGRMAMIVNSIGCERDVVMTGGVAKNAGVMAALEKMLGMRIKRVNRADPQLAGAIGAALYAAEKAKGGAV